MLDPGHKAVCSTSNQEGSSMEGMKQTHQDLEMKSSKIR